MLLLTLIVPCYFVELVSTASAMHHSDHPILIVVSYDAFRYNYFDQYNGSLVHMEKLRQEGTHADYLINVFPTKTFPNHQSIATGLYPEEHGVIGNSFYDPELKEIVHQSEDMYAYNNDKIIPIWTLNEMISNTRFSGSMMWPGAIHPFHNHEIAHTVAWERDYDWNMRIDKALEWLVDPEKPANLVMIYFEEPDSMAHIYGPDSETVLNILKRLDNVTQYLHDRLKQMGLEDVANVVHLSDHGMSGVTLNNIINITKYLKKDTFEIADSSPCLHVIPDSDYVEETYQRLKNQSETEGNFTVYRKSDLPARWHFKDNRRTPPILVLAKEGYAFQDIAEMAENITKKYHINPDPRMGTHHFGVHGYDNTMKDMYPFFMARGPRIKKNYKVAPFHTVDLYLLFSNILEIFELPETNGSFSNVRDVLITVARREDAEGRPWYTSTGIVTVAVILACLLFMALGAGAIVVVIKCRQTSVTAVALNKRYNKIEAQQLLLEPEEA